MKLLKELLERPLKGVMLGAAIFLFGLTLVWPFPAIVLYSYRIAANNSIEAASEALAKTRATYDLQSQWILPKYLTYDDGRDLVSTLDRSTTGIDGNGGARDVLSKCHGKVSEKITCLRNAKLLADLTAQEIALVTAKLSENEVLIQNAREELRNFSTKEINAQKVEAESFYAQETPNHRLIYTQPVRNYLDNIAGKLTTIEMEVNQAISVMPPDEIHEMRGDPQLALDEINHAKMVVDEINTLMSAVTSTLGDLKTARESAGPTTDHAASSITIADQVINTINSRYGWGFELALKPAVTSLSNSRSELESTRNTLSTQVLPEGKIDWTLAYSQAQSSLNGALRAKASAEKQEQDYLSAVGKINQYPIEVSGANTAISSASSAVNTLRTYHASDTWSTVSNNLTFASQKMGEADSNMAMAKSDIAIAIQQFTEADRLAQTSLDLVATAKTKAMAVSTLTDTLEGFRKSWSGLERQAQSTINDEKPGPRSDNCAYSSSARSDLADAITYLNQARDAANNGHYEVANSLATSAYNSAYGVNGRCIRAYDDEMGSRTQVAAAATKQEESRIAAQEAAERAEEEAQQRAIEEANRPADTGGYEPTYNQPSNDGGGWENSESSSNDGGGWDE